MMPPPTPCDLHAHSHNTRVADRVTDDRLTDRQTDDIYRTQGST